MSVLLARLLSFILPQLEKYILRYLIKVGTYLWRTISFSKAVDQKADALKKAGTDPALTPEQKAKEQEDAFDKLVDAANKP